jgi:hypothetical protein
MHLFCVCALLNVQVSDQVRDRVGLDDHGDGDTRELGYGNFNVVNVLLIKLFTIVINRQFTEGDMCRAVAVWEVIEDERSDRICYIGLIDRLKVLCDPWDRVVPIAV